MKNNIIEKKRWMNVVKQNDLVQKVRYKLDLVQQKTIMYLCSQIDSTKDVEFQDITVDIRELCEIMGIRYNGKNLKDFKDAIQKLSDKSMWVDTGKQIQLMRWLQRVNIDKGSTKVTVRFDELMAPYLLQIKGRFTQYNLINVLPMKSQYSLRLYELIKSYCGLGEWKIYLDELRKLLYIESSSYLEFYEFKRKVLDKAVEEINCFTDIQIAFDTTRTNRKISGIRFVMVDHLSVEDMSRRRINQDVALGNIPTGQVSKPNKLTVQDIRGMQQLQKKAREMKELSEKYKKPDPVDYSEEVSFMPGQQSLFDI